MKKPQTKFDCQLCGMEKFIPIQNETDSLPTIIVLDPVPVSSRGKFERNGEDKYRALVTKRHSLSSLCQVREPINLSIEFWAGSQKAEEP